MITKGLIFYIGCALLPSPPSPCYDFDLQFIRVLVMKIDKALKLWERGVNRLTNPKNKYLRAVAKIVVRRNFVQRLVVGYF